MLAAYWLVGVIGVALGVFIWQVARTVRGFAADLRAPSEISFNELVYQRVVEATFRTGLAHHVRLRGDGGVDVIVMDDEGSETTKIWTREQVISGNI